MLTMNSWSSGFYLSGVLWLPICVTTPGFYIVLGTEPRAVCLLTGTLQTVLHSQPPPFFFETELIEPRLVLNS